MYFPDVVFPLLDSTEQVMLFGSISPLPLNHDKQIGVYTSQPSWKPPSPHNKAQGMCQAESKPMKCAREE